MTVSDTGIGIAETDLQYIFEPFHRGKNVDTISGTGLGMTIIKRSVDLFNGVISISSKINEGTSICIEIPLSKM